MPGCVVSPLRLLVQCPGQALTQGSPAAQAPLLASAGIDSSVKLWMPQVTARRRERKA